MTEQSKVNGEGERERPESPASGMADLASLLAELEGDLVAEGETAEARGGEATGAAAQERPEVFILFSLAGGRYAVAMDRLREVGRVPAYTAVPNVPRWVRGVANFRGEILSLVDLGDFLGLGPAPSLELCRVLVAEGDNGEVASGLVVERIDGEAAVVLAEIQPPAASTPPALTPYLAGVFRRAGDVRAVLDMDALLGSPAFKLMRGGV